MASGRLFQARGPATAKARSLNVDRVAGTIRSDGETERRRRGDSMLAKVLT